MLNIQSADVYVCSTCCSTNVSESMHIYVNSVKKNKDGKWWAVIDMDREMDNDGVCFCDDCNRHRILCHNDDFGMEE